ncbi:MAG: hypothetical protein AAF413_04390 [Patescibacteria group bacterium]
MYFPFTKDEVLECMSQSPLGGTVYLYDEATIIERANRVQGMLDGNFFAQKASPFGPILDVIAATGMGQDCATITELKSARARRACQGQELFFTSAATDFTLPGGENEFVVAHQMGAILNIGKASYVDKILDLIGDPGDSIFCLRYNPGDMQSGDEIIGEPVKTPFGDTLENLIEGYRKLAERGVKRFALHTMVGGGMLDVEYFAITAKLLADAARRIEDETGIDLEIINVGGGMGIPYRPEQSEIDIDAVSEVIREQLDEFDCRIVSEFGRYITGPAGWLATSLTHGVVHTYENHLPVNHSPNNSARFASISNVFHKTHVIGKDSAPSVKVSLHGQQCSGSNKYLEGISVPKDIESGDILVIHDAGAHMAGNRTYYNSLSTAAGFMKRTDGSIIKVHEGVTPEQIMALNGINLPGIESLDG